MATTFNHEDFNNFYVQLKSNHQAINTEEIFGILNPVRFQCSNIDSLVKDMVSSYENILRTKPINRV